MKCYTSWGNRGLLKQETLARASSATARSKNCRTLLDFPNRVVQEKPPAGAALQRAI